MTRKLFWEVMCTITAIALMLMILGSCGDDYFYEVTGPEVNLGFQRAEEITGGVSCQPVIVKTPVADFCHPKGGTAEACVSTWNLILITLNDNIPAQVCHECIHIASMRKFGDYYTGLKLWDIELCNDGRL